MKIVKRFWLYLIPLFYQFKPAEQSTP